MYASLFRGSRRDEDVADDADDTCGMCVCVYACTAAQTPRASVHKTISQLVCRRRRRDIYGILTTALTRASISRHAGTPFTHSARNAEKVCVCVFVFVCICVFTSHTVELFQSISDMRARASIRAVLQTAHTHTKQDVATRRERRGKKTRSKINGIIRMCSRIGGVRFSARSERIRLYGKQVYNTYINSNASSSK